MQKGREGVPVLGELIKSFPSYALLEFGDNFKFSRQNFRISLIMNELNEPMGPIMKK